jgi:hypothetical protein
LLWVEIDSEFDASIKDIPWFKVNPASQPVVLSATDTKNSLTVGLSVEPDGATVLDRMIGQEYADVKFRWSAYSQRDTFDTASFKLRLEEVSPPSDLINNSFIGALINQPHALLIPDGRTYPALADREDQTGEPGQDMSTG